MRNALRGATRLLLAGGSHLAFSACFNLGLSCERVARPKAALDAFLAALRVAETGAALAAADANAASALAGTSAAVASRARPALSAIAPAALADAHVAPLNDSMGSRGS